MADEPKPQDQQAPKDEGLQERISRIEKHLGLAKDERPAAVKRDEKLASRKRH